jgi:hypothetical protein
MGLPVDVVGQGAPTEVQYRHPRAWALPTIAQELAFSPSPRFLLSVFSTDRPGILKTALRKVAQTFHLDDLGTQVRFTIDGSLSSAVHGTFTMSFLLRPVFVVSRDREQRVNHAVKNRVMPELAHNIRLSIAEEVGPATVQVMHTGFEVRNDSIFRDRYLSEYRFLFNRASTSSDQCSALAGHIAALLGRHGVPITYLYFPDFGRGVANLPTLVVGLAPLRDGGNQVEIDLEANTLAFGYQARFEKALFESAGVSEHRLIRIGDYRHPTSVAPHSGAAKDWDAGPVDLVFARFVARPGLVGEMLSEHEASTASHVMLLGGSMTVLAGHTVACWVLREGSGQRLEHRISEIAEKSGLSEEVSLHRSVGVRTPSEQFSPQTPCWLAWDFPDMPAVFADIVRALNDYLFKNFGIEPDYKYSVSRVLEQGHRCAGKLKFSLPAETAVRLEADLQRVSDSLISILELAKGPGELSSSSSLVVRMKEPLEQPWGMLSVL